MAQARPVAKPVLVPDVSQRNIEIAYSFTGADLLLFGAILYPGGRLPDEAKRTDIVVVVKGPTQSILVREKAKVAGIWVNAARLRYRSAPSFYAIASSRPIASLIDQRTQAIYELGLDSLQLSPASSAAPAEQDRFARGLVDLKRRGGLYVEAPRAVEITDGVLYRARLNIPARVPVGRFTAETFLIRDGRVLAAATRDIDIRKSGFERFVARAAERRSVSYGLAAVILSIAFGWAAGWIARRV
ncbi:MAG: TIGR02186 family protein [Sphingomonas sp.]